MESGFFLGHIGFSKRTCDWIIKNLDDSFHRPAPLQTQSAKLILEPIKAANQSIVIIWRNGISNVKSAPIQNSKYWICIQAYSQLIQCQWAHFHQSYCSTALSNSNIILCYYVT